MGPGKHLPGIVAAMLAVAGAAHGEPLRIFYFDWAGYGPFFLAQEKGFYAQEGIEVELVPVADTHAAYAGLFSGHVDAIAAVIQDIPFFWTPDDHLVCVLAISYSNGADGIVARNDIASVADLKGRTVAYEDGSSTHFYLSVVLEEAGLNEADIEAVEVPDSDAVTAFLLGEVDALSTYGGMLIEALQAPHAHLLTELRAAACHRRLSDHHAAGAAGASERLQGFGARVEHCRRRRRGKSQRSDRDHGRSDRWCAR